MSQSSDKWLVHYKRVMSTIEFRLIIFLFFSDAHILFLLYGDLILSIFLVWCSPAHKENQNWSKKHTYMDEYRLECLIYQAHCCTCSKCSIFKMHVINRFCKKGAMARAAVDLIASDFCLSGQLWQPWVHCSRLFLPQLDFSCSRVEKNCFFPIMTNLICNPTYIWA